MSTQITVCALALLSTAAALILKGTGRREVFFIGLAFSTAVSVRVISNVEQSVDFLRRLSEGTEAGKYLDVLLKTAGIAFLTDLSADLCRGAGENVVAGCVEFAGKAEITVPALPLLSELLELSFGLLSL